MHRVINLIRVTAIRPDNGALLEGDRRRAPVFFPAPADPPSEV